MTRSPGTRFCTDEPTCSTTPMNSCPKVVPTLVSGIRPWYRCRSDPQIAALVTRTIASLGCSIGGTSFSSTRTLYGPRYTIARIHASVTAAGWSPSYPGTARAIGGSATHTPWVSVAVRSADGGLGKVVAVGELADCVAGHGSGDAGRDGPDALDGDLGLPRCGEQAVAL